jgi:hypothetical protein
METMNQEEKKRCCPRPLKYIGWGILGTIGIAAFGFLFGYFVMLLWNWLMPMLFGLVTITFWQAVGIVILAKLIFGGCRFPAHHPKEHRDHSRRSRCGNKHEDWKKWKYYGQYWKEQGEQDFDAYIKKKEESGEANPAL